MDKFNTHGGYFAPQGLLKINEGGKHAENPNGGVQLGVDGEGIPNLVEEGEIVYKDFVYSDNIKAKKDILEKFSIPTKYADKLYSDIANAYCDEAEEQIDPVTLNGLNIMLGRLAQAQEEQKHIEEEKALMKELQNMSPDELEALEAALAQEQQTQQEEIENQEYAQQVAPEEVAPAEVAPVQPMANGGQMNQYGGGGGRVGNKGQKALNLLRDVSDMLSPVGQKQITMPDGNIINVQYGIGNAAAPENIAATLARGEKMIADAAKQHDSVVARSMIKEGKRMIKFANKLKGTALKEAPVVVESAPAVETTKATKHIPWGKIGVGVGIGLGIPAYNLYMQNHGEPEPSIEGAPDYVFDPNDFACGGRVHKYDDGGWADFLKSLGEYQMSRKPGGVKGTYAIDRNFPLAGFDSIKSLEDSDAYRSFTDYVLANPEDENVLNYLRALDAGTSSGVAKLFNGDTLADNWKDLFNSRRYDQKGGIYHFSTDDIAKLPGRRDVGPLLPKVDGPVTEDQRFYEKFPRVFAPKTGLAAASNPSVMTDDTNKTRAQFDTRYLSPLMDVAMGLANLATPADHYSYTPIRPYLPSGYLRQQYERYNPIDQNMVTNQMESRAQANARALRNAGLGPALGATLLASDYNAGQNLGNALANVWDANNQRRNQVIQQNNQADAALGNFYWDVDQADANALNQVAPYNQRMALAVQQMNNEAEQDKYNAVASSLNSVKKFLADSGWERINRRMANSNRGNLGYTVDEYGNIIYKPGGYACGGTLLKAHKK